ncbi:MAG: galactokinase [Pontixanthobacter sp.]
MSDRQAVGGTTVTVPGRVNLIGEHTDYNGGWVLPATLSVCLTVDLTPRSDDWVHVRAHLYDDVAIRTIDDAATGDWSDPVIGAVREAIALNLLTGGADVVVTSSIPAGSGLSSSAALIVAILKAARSLGMADGATQAIDDTLIARAARRVENEYLGVPCGIMDQMAISLAAPGQAMALDTGSLDYRLVSLPKTHDFVVIHSGHTRRLTDGRYAARREECAAAERAFGTDSLCLLDPEVISAAQNLDATLRRRALHCATEHLRVLAAVDALAASDMAQMGALMNASHTSMRDDFAITIPAIDQLVADAIAMGATGARMTGGGFGGCIVACVAREKRRDWQEALLDAHPEARFIDAIVPS